MDTTEKQAVEVELRLGWVPRTMTEFEHLRTLTCEELKAIGCGRWEEATTLMLFPATWYEHIPAGFEVVDINGDKEAFVPGVTDDDRRFGRLAYGVCGISN